MDVLEKYKNKIQLNIDEEESLLKLFFKNPEIGKIVKVFFILTTYPDNGTQNVGDNFITKSCIDLIKLLYKSDNRPLFCTMFRMESLEHLLPAINNSQGIILPGFPIRVNMSNIYEFANYYTSIKCPFIPVGCGQNMGVGAIDKMTKVKYKSKDNKFITYINNHSPLGIGTRDPIVLKQLQFNNIKAYGNVGDCALYDINTLFTKFNYKSIQTIIFTQPHQTAYKNQSNAILDMINDIFPNADKICAFHGKDNNINDYAKKVGLL